MSATNLTTYTAHSGDSLWGIAKKFGVTLDQLLTANPVKKANPGKINVGESIYIPVNSFDYTVQSGDTLSKIGARYGVTAKAIQSANAASITNINVIEIGQKIRIPLATTNATLESPQSQPATQKSAQRFDLDADSYIQQLGENSSQLQEPISSDPFFQEPVKPAQSPELSHDDRWQKIFSEYGSIDDAKDKICPVPAPEVKVEKITAETENHPTQHHNLYTSFVALSQQHPSLNDIKNDPMVLAAIETQYGKATRHAFFVLSHAEGIADFTDLISYGKKLDLVYTTLVATQAFKNSPKTTPEEKVQAVLNGWKEWAGGTDHYDIQNSSVTRLLDRFAKGEKKLAYCGALTDALILYPLLKLNVDIHPMAGTALGMGHSWSSYTDSKGSIQYVEGTTFNQIPETRATQYNPDAMQSKDSTNSLYSKYDKVTKPVLGENGDINEAILEDFSVYDNMARDFEAHITQGSANSDSYGRLFSLNRLAFLALKKQLMFFGKTEKMQKILLNTVTVANRGLNNDPHLDADQKSDCAKNLLAAAVELETYTDYPQSLFSALKQLLGKGYSQEIRTALKGDNTTSYASQIFKHAFQALKVLIVDPEQNFSNSDINCLTDYFNMALQNNWGKKDDINNLLTTLQQKTTPDDAVADQLVSLGEQADR